MNTGLTRACAALASVLVTFAILAGVASLADPDHADPRIAAIRSATAS